MYIIHDVAKWVHLVWNSPMEVVDHNGQEYMWWIVLVSQSAWHKWYVVQLGIM